MLFILAEVGVVQNNVEEKPLGMMIARAKIVKTANVRANCQLKVKIVIFLFRSLFYIYLNIAEKYR